MSLLTITATAGGVGAEVVDDDGGTPAAARREVARHEPGPDRVEQAPEELWRATLEAVRDVLAQADGRVPRAVHVTDEPDTVVLWDRDTLGSPRRVILGADRRTAEVCSRLRAAHGPRVAALTGQPVGPTATAVRLAWLAEHEPHTWALVVDGRYAVGGVGSYLVARMTRGLEHVAAASGAPRTLLLESGAGDWSTELCGLFGVPRDALPELVTADVAATDPRTFAGLELPVALLDAAATPP